MPFDPQIYRLASIARDKLCQEAARASHNLRVLVAHANILDELLIELNTPGGTSTDYYGFNLLPQEVPTDRSARRNVVVTVEESSEHTLEDGRTLEHSSHLSSSSSPSSPPLLSHDSESESDSASDSDASDDSDDSDDFSTIITPTSPTDSSTISMSSINEDDVKLDEEDIGLHRIKSVWALFGGTGSSSAARQKQKGTNSITAVTKDIEQLDLSSV